MAQLSYSGRALADLERIIDFLQAEGPGLALDTLDLIDEALALLRRHPLIGRPAEAGLRELVISQGRTGYLALYACEERADAVLVLSIRHQRDAGYQG